MECGRWGWLNHQLVSITSTTADPVTTNNTATSTIGEQSSLTPASPRAYKRQHRRGHDDELHHHDGQRRPEHLDGNFTDSLPANFTASAAKITSSVQGGASTAN